MSNSLPVPSKGALRALRNIALGTSCTVAVSAGLLTEDRRRRIHAARAVQQNGQRIKGSKSYHESAGAVAIAALEEHVLSPEYFSSTEDRHVLPPPGTWRSESISTHFAHEVPTAPSHTQIAPPPFIPSNDVVPAPPTTKPFKVLPPPSQLNSLEPKRAGISESPSMHNAIATARSLLATGRLSNTLQSINTILDHLRKYGVRADEKHSLVKVCAEIYEQCVLQSNVQAYLPLLKEVLRGPFSEKDYYRLRAPDTALRLLQLRATQVGAEDDAKYLQAAISIFLKLRKRSTGTAVLAECKREGDRDAVRRGMLQMSELARKLPAAAFEAHLWQKTVDVCKRISRTHEREAPLPIAYSILAHHEMGNYHQVIKQFRSDFPASEPSISYHNRVVAAALDTAMKQRRIDVAEDVVVIGAEKARAGEFNMRVEFFNKVLGNQWRQSHDLVKTKVMFEGLEAFVDVLDRPEALYCTMMQFCIEASDEASAWLYFDKQVSESNDISLTVQLRTSGHLALASAMRGDWEEAKNLIRGIIAEAGKPAEKKVVSEVFAPLFKLFAAKHSAQQTEAFLRDFLAEGLQLHSFTFNIMVNKFAEDMDMESVNRWLNEAVQLGLAKADAATFNSILTALRDEWGMPYEELFNCVREMKNKDASMVDGVTFNIMRDQLIRDARGNRMHFARYLKRLQSLLPGGGESKGYSHENDLRIMRTSIAKGSNVKALKHYQYVTEDENAYVSPNMFGLAIKACLDMDSENKLDVAMQMVADARKRGVDISQGVTRLLLWRIEESGSSWRKGTVKTQIREMMTALAAQEVEIPLSVIVHMGNLLCDRGVHSKALNIWEQYMREGGVQRQDVTMSCLTMLLRIHLHMQNTHGLEWIMQTMAMNMLPPDKSFMVQLKYGKRNVKKAIYEAAEAGPRGAYSKQHEYLALLEALYERLKAQRVGKLKQSRSATARLLGIMQEAVEEEKKGATERALPTSKEPLKAEKSTFRSSFLPEKKRGEKIVRSTFEQEELQDDLTEMEGLDDMDAAMQNSLDNVVMDQQWFESGDELLDSLGHVDTWPKVIITKEPVNNRTEVNEARRARRHKKWLETIHQAQKEVEEEKEKKREKAEATI